MSRIKAPPASPRRRRWTPPHIGSYFVRSSDHTVWQCKNVYRRDQQVQLVADVSSERVYIGARELERDYQIVVR